MPQPSKFSESSTPWGSQGKARGDTDETAVGDRLSPSAGGDGAIFTSLSIALGLSQMKTVLVEGETGQGVQGNRAMFSSGLFSVQLSSRLLGSFCLQVTMLLPKGMYRPMS